MKTPSSCSQCSRVLGRRLLKRKRVRMKATKRRKRKRRRSRSRRVSPRMRFFHLLDPCRLCRCYRSCLTGQMLVSGTSEVQSLVSCVLSGQCWAVSLTLYELSCLLCETGVPKIHPRSAELSIWPGS